MDKISQGVYEIFTSRADAINKFMQLQDICRDEISGGNSVEFFCSKKGKILIANPPKRHVESTNATKLFAEIIERDGKTYVTYYTAFSKSANVIKLICILMQLLMIAFAFISAIMSGEKMHYFIVLGLGLVLFASLLFTAVKEEGSSPEDSEILIRELERRVEAVNLWEK